MFNLNILLSLSWYSHHKGVKNYESMSAEKVELLSDELTPSPEIGTMIWLILHDEYYTHYD